jgi:hypothetical protein
LPGLSVNPEQATIRDGTLRVKVRTVMPPGPGIDIAADQPAALLALRRRS